MKIVATPEWMQKRNEFLLGSVRNLEAKNKELESRIETMKGVLYFTFMLSAFAILLVIEKLLSPFLRTL